jgi:hypothetical protein
MSIAHWDQRLLDLQEQIALKENQLKEDYRHLQRDIKHNPHLEAALVEYKDYFAKAKTEKDKQIKALTGLIHSLEKIPNAKSDIIDIKREIKYIKQK